MRNLIFGHTWEEIQAMQQKTYAGPVVDLSTPGDYGADPISAGQFRMIPSGEIVDLKERNRRLIKCH